MEAALALGAILVTLLRTAYRATILRLPGGADTVTYFDNTLTLVGVLVFWTCVALICKALMIRWRFTRSPVPAVSLPLLQKLWGVSAVSATWTTGLALFLVLHATPQLIDLGLYWAGVLLAIVQLLQMVCMKKLKQEGLKYKGMVRYLNSYDAASLFKPDLESTKPRTVMDEVIALSQR